MGRSGAEVGHEARRLARRTEVALSIHGWGTVSEGGESR
jgi:hypothetical protein